MVRLVHVESVRLVGSVPLDVRHGALTQGEWAAVGGDMHLNGRWKLQP